MNAFMPSEIARLVLGYLKEISCVNASRHFLDECPYLNEYRECLLNGLQYPTDIAGKGLRTILNEYYLLKLAASNVNIDHNGQTDKSQNTPRHEVNSNQLDDSFSTPYLNEKIPQVVNEDPLNQSIRRKSSPPKKKNHLNSTPRRPNGENIEEENDEDNQNAETLDIGVLLEQLMNSRALHEKIAENINKHVTTSGNEENQPAEEKELTIKEIVNQTESDPVFEEFLTTFVDNLKADAGLDVTQTQIDDIDALAEIHHCNTPLNAAPSPDSPLSVQTGNGVEQIPIPSSVVEITSGEVEKTNEESGTTVVANLPPGCASATPEQKQTFCFPTSSNHLILKTPHKTSPCLQFITISPSEIDWPTLSNLNLVLASPYSDILNNVDGRNVSNCDSLTKTVLQSSSIANTTTTVTTTSASPAQFLKTKNRVDCHVIRDLNFGGEPRLPESTKEINRSPVLNTLVNSAKKIVQTDKNQKSKRGPHIRVLEFKSSEKDKRTASELQPNPNVKKRKPPNMNRKLKRPRRENRRGLTDMDVETFLNNLCYVE